MWHEFKGLGTDTEHLPTQKYYDSVTLRGNEPQHENVLATTIITFGSSFAKRALGVQNDLLVLCAY